MLEEFRATDLVWDSANRYLYDTVRTSSSDEKGRKLVVQVLNDGVVENMQGYKLSLSWESKVNDTSGLDEFTLIDADLGIYEIYYTTGMLSNVGKLRANLYLSGGNSNITSESFTLEVFEGVDMKRVEASDSFSTLSGYIIRLQGLEKYAGEVADLEADIQANEDDRRQKELDRRTSETSRVNAENIRKTNEDARKLAETVRDEEESIRDIAEDLREDNEDVRKENEVARKSAETSRVTAEGLRVNAEKSRVTAEQGRVNAELARETVIEDVLENEQVRDNKEADRVTAESGRVTAEQGRVTAEGLRVNAESTRVTSEADRESKEEERELNETGRVTAEESRVTSEQGREEAESIRVEAEQGRDGRISDLETGLSATDGVVSVHEEDIAEIKQEIRGIIEAKIAQKIEEAKGLATLPPTIDKKLQNVDSFVDMMFDSMYEIVAQKPAGSPFPEVLLKDKISTLTSQTNTLVPKVNRAMVVVKHGNQNGVIRPSGAIAVYWVGSVEPMFAEENDLWVGGL